MPKVWEDMMDRMKKQQKEPVLKKGKKKITKKGKKNG
jgi:hypothetical protein